MCFWTDKAWYSYNDVTCTYGCQKTEYFYWLLTSYLDGQDAASGVGSGYVAPEGRSEQIYHEYVLQLANNHSAM